ncbi:unnamed protein product, partial [Rotaria magnacalcarata]
MSCEQNEILTLPDDLWSYSDDVFYDFVKEYVGEIETEILKIQRIKNVQTLLQVPDVCFIADDMTFMVRAGVRFNIQQFINLLKLQFESRLINVNVGPSATTTPIENKKSDQCLCNLINIDTENNQQESKLFINILLRNLLKNMKRSKNNFQFDPIVMKFSSVFRGLAGRNAYEFIRINMLGSLPSDTTLKNYDENINFQLKECEFRFGQMKDYLGSIKSQYVFSSEDATGVISCVSYDCNTDCFTGFTTLLNNNDLPVINHFKTNSYN